MKRIGILGGTFNPIHIGHLLLAEWAMDAAALEEVWLIPAGVPYMKNPKDIAAAEHRLSMTELAVNDHPRFKCLAIEICRNRYTYSFETLKQLHEQYPENKFFFIVGADCLFSIENWKNPEEIFMYSTIIAAIRNDAVFSDMEAKKLSLAQKYHGEIMLLPFMRMSVSSTEIRQRIKNGQSVRYLLPKKVLAYIDEKGLYREKSY